MPHPGKWCRSGARSGSIRWTIRNCTITNSRNIGISLGVSDEVALAERLGAWFEREYDNVSMGRDMLYRHPGPDAATDTVTDAASGRDDDGSVEAYA